MESGKSNLKRLHLSTLYDAEKENGAASMGQCCKNVLQLVDLKCTEVANTIKELQDTVCSQNEAIMSALATQNAIVKSLVRQEKSNAEVRTAFPLKGIEDLRALNQTIDEDNRQIYVKTMKSLLKGKLHKTLTAVLSIEVILDVNVDGTHGKKRLKDFPNFFDALMDCIRSLSEDPDKELRKALNVIKKRHFHNVCVQKKVPK